MKNNIITISAVILLAIVLCLVLFFPRKISGPSNSSTPSNPQSAQNSQPAQNSKVVYANATTDLIQVVLPFPDAVVGKDFSVIGKARGVWFFEASFPLEVLDKDGAVLARTTAHPQGGADWMTTNFVNFKVDIKVPQSYIGPAVLVLRKDNPSGMSENDASVSFPITIEY